MALKNSATKYGLLSKLFHWILGLTFIALMAVGLYMEDMDAVSLKWTLYKWHKSIGFLMVIGVAMRLLWTMYNKPPMMVTQNLKKIEIRTAKIVHWLLYLSLIAMPLSGWIMSGSDKHPDGLVYGGTLPQWPKLEWLNNIASDVHEYAPYVVIATIVLHILGALKHHIIIKDDTLRRMWF